MSLAIVYSRAQSGIESREVMVEVHLAPGMPSLSIVGLPETAVKESKDRVRSAILNVGFEFPTRRITVNLAPADLPKEGGRYDLPIAIGILAASGQVPGELLERYEFVGELALGGGLRRVSGLLPCAIAAAKRGRGIFVPREDAEQAALSDAAEVLPAEHLLRVTAHLNGSEPLARLSVDVQEAPPPLLDLGEVKGQFLAKRALALAAAGGHNLLLAGPPGAGKTMLAQRLPGLLPPLSEDEAIETASVWSLTDNGFDLGAWKRRPFRCPHHSISAAALIGGGSHPMPGEVSLSHNGVLFLDEFPEFGPRVLDQLREPMETHEVHISRVAAQRRYPARFMLIAAMNLCKCGKLGDPGAICLCSPEQVQRYQARVSGPLMDRIDLHVHVNPVPHVELQRDSDEQTYSKAVRAEVLAAWATQLDRQGMMNAQLTGSNLEQHCVLDAQGRQLLIDAGTRLGFSARSHHRILRVARTIADMDNQLRITGSHLAEAIQYRVSGSL